MKSDLFDEQTAEVPAAGLLTKQNSKMLKASLDAGSLQARRGTMIAYQGQVKFEHQSMTFDKSGLKKMIKKAVTGEGLDLMQVTGTGEVFFADQAADIHIIELENESLSINGMNILAFSDSLQWDIKLIRSAGMMSGGLFNTTVSGSGQIAVSTHGSPVVLNVGEAPTFVDPDAAVCWSADLQISSEVSLDFKSMIGRSSGEGMQLGFKGEGIVVVQPDESMRYGAGQRQADGTQQQTSTPLGGLGKLLGN